MKLSELERIADSCEQALLAVIPPVLLAVTAILALAWW